MNVLIIGGGGREHALAWKAAQSPLVEHLYCAPGNPGIGAVAECVAIGPADLPALASFARGHRVGLTIVGPEQPLAAGIADLFEAEGLPVFGPTRAAARLETSKIFAKEFMQRNGIPTAPFRTFAASERQEAERWIAGLRFPAVLKADGLAAGKGVVVCESRGQAMETLGAMFDRRQFGEAGLRLVVEEFLEGEEASVFAICDGGNFVLLPPAQDHKRIFDGDKGKNTGGMGAFAPSPSVTPAVMHAVAERIIRPTLDGMRREGTPYKGCLYIGLMLTAGGPQVIEYNCRFGDPETQAVMPLLGSDLVALALAAAVGKLPAAAEILPLSAVCVVVASGGYPDAYETGKPIAGLERLPEDEDILVFHAGTSIDPATGSIVTAGGRVLGVTALGPVGDLASAVGRAYRAVEGIHFERAYYRKDIGRRGIQKQSEQRNVP
ncbi:MAG TPA: phosphoribosylamine--glycine ligase [Bacteroidota bacterium]|nr:phosphoribosylamine--glycine ligase [Bacteroidota bacterium]